MFGSTSSGLDSNTFEVGSSVSTSGVFALFVASLVFEYGENGVVAEPNPSFTLSALNGDGSDILRADCNPGEA